MYITIVFKPRLLSNSNQNQILHEESIGRGNNVFKNPVHITKMGDMPIFGKKLQKSSTP